LELERVPLTPATPPWPFGPYLSSCQLAELEVPGLPKLPSNINRALLKAGVRRYPHPRHRGGFLWHVDDLPERAWFFLHFGEVV